ncbi:carbamoyltransferase HypF [candidate division WOR-3 bacterium]|nr:carbamoyltransferase HypF [candidate division WOR-3 bacterium]
MKKIRIRAIQIFIKGVVQGVGFRPFVYRIATAHNLRGVIQNRANGVFIEVEGKNDDVNMFLKELESESPPISRIEEIKTQRHLPVGYKEFSIKGSAFDKAKGVLISPDVATCDSCLEELFNSSNRRFHYPFINCTNCGPRFTITCDVPYDRPNTTMQEFQMCNECQSEYDNPSNRRFHAQPNACPVCGPEVELLEISKLDVKSRGYRAVEDAARLLKEGKILAIKGLGGFHLACDATNDKVIRLLRRRKSRDSKPFALMAKDLVTVKKYCKVSSREQKSLLSYRRPIVLLKKKLDLEGVATRNKYLGFMLPYTPLHHLLFDISNVPPVLVMTSGNISDEPITYKNKNAATHLKNIADFLLTHNRKIHMRCDDSVVRIFKDKQVFIRRSRGYIPEPIELPFKTHRDILACGGELKNTFCLIKGRYAFLSHYIGDMENIEVLNAFTEGIRHFKHIFSIKPDMVAYDLHPEYLPTKYALEVLTKDPELKGVGIQHHHAHIASCMAENGISGEVIGVSFDGLGYGTDGNLWGGEFFIANYKGFRRKAHLDYIPMPGGVLAIKEPWRMTASYLWHIFGDEFLKLGIEFTRSIDKDKWEVLKNLVRHNVNSPLTSGAGRLFDAVSALLGICRFSYYEGQAAIELEGNAEENYYLPYDYEISGEIIKTDKIFMGMVEDIRTKKDVGIITARFHRTISEIIIDMCCRIRKDSDLNMVALSGGVFQNMILLRQVVDGLREKRFDVYINHRVPTNDGGISLGQAVIANSRIKMPRKDTFAIELQTVQKSKIK